MTDEIQAYPLCWPQGRPRTKYSERSRFDTTQDSAQQNLIWELERLGARDVVVSTDIPLRRDGLPYADRRTPDDRGVAVYFLYEGERVCFACDRWDRIGDNMQAIRKTIEALRGIARWGTGDMMKAAFTGFTALPPPITNDWRTVLGVDDSATYEEAKRAFNQKAKTAHPDHGGSVAAMAELNAAFDEARKQLR